jgi:prepilin-type N-terminal cleavage/methylation domain-containing protein
METKRFFLAFVSFPHTGGRTVPTLVPLEGFTLIEVALALAILAVTLSGLLL